MFHYTDSKVIFEPLLKRNFEFLAFYIYLFDEWNIVNTGMYT